MEALKDFQEIIDQMNEEHNKYVSKENHSNSFATFLKARENKLQFILDSVFDSMAENDNTIVQLSNEVGNQKEIAEKFAIVCYYHGISDCESYLRYKKEDLLNLLRPDEHLNGRFIQMPLEHWNFTFPDGSKSKEPKEIKYSDKPIYKFEQLKELALKHRKNHGG